jgi:hypothetical protein
MFRVGLWWLAEVDGWLASMFRAGFVCSQKWRMDGQTARQADMFRAGLWWLASKFECRAGLGWFQ